MELWVSNSGATPITANAHVSRIAKDGTTISTHDVPVSLQAGDSQPFWSGRLSVEEILWVDSDDDTFDSNRFFSGEVKDLGLADSEVTHEVALGTDGTAKIVLRSTGYAYFTHITSPFPEARYSDNYIDLRDGEERTIHVTDLPNNATPEAFTVTGLTA